MKTARAQSGKGRTKTDGLDAAAMCSLTIRGLGRRPYLPVDAVGKLQVAYLGREALASHRSALRNQITSLLDLIWPGATAEDKDRGAGLQPIPETHEACQVPSNRRPALPEGATICSRWFDRNALIRQRPCRLR